MTEHETESRRDDMGDHVARWRESGVEITEFGGQLVAYLPDADDAWISGWVEVPR